MTYDLILAFCENEGNIVLKAPAMSRLKEGQTIYFASTYGDQEAEVLGSYYFSADYENDVRVKNLLLKATETKEPLNRVISKINIEEFEYEKESED